MLDCGNNFKGTLKQICDECHTLDNEDHRMNYCGKWDTINYVKDSDKKVFDMIYSNDINDIREILPAIENVWKTKNAHGTMNLN